jgi:hypothetical protein
MISIFKTSIKDLSDVEELKPLLDSFLKDAKWNFDLKDCDNILRIDSPSKISDITINLLQHNGYTCEELLD